MKSAMVLLSLVSVGGLAGCGKPPSIEPPGAQVSNVHKHDGWWCDEHGVPEEICAQCNTKVAGDFKAKGDWCKEHDRPDSQCFVCHPDLERAFAAQYEAKYGKKPPKPQGEPQS
jgi:hypothetical protein